MNCKISSGECARPETASALAVQNRLFGRDSEIGELLEILDRVQHGSGELLLLPGVSGTGKTALANVLREPTLAQNGFFLHGKFNQFDQNVAYVAWRQALAQFCRIIGGFESSERQRWAENILDAVGSNGQLLVELVPEFEALLGTQAPVDTIGSQEARHRFASVIRQTLQVICQPEHPLVLFIDDWQWADPASLHLLNQLQVGSTLRFVMIVAAYRSDEVLDSHDFATSLQVLKNQSVPMTQVDVQNLSREEVAALTRQSIGFRGEDLSEIADNVHEISKGNPFFAHALLESLPRSVLTNAPSTTQDAEDAPPCDIVDVFKTRIRQLALPAQELLSLAACLGHRFDLDTLSLISGHGKEQCQDLLRSARSLVVGSADSVAGRGHVNAQHTTFEFLHDRVQQAAHSRIKPDEMSGIRLEIARKLQSELPANELHERVCEIVEHFNAGSQLACSDDERLRGVELNILAARRAAAATAFRSALQYHRAARVLLSDPRLLDRLWNENHELAMALFLEQAESEFLEGDTEVAEQCIRTAAAHAKSDIKKSEALSMLVVQHTLQAHYDQAIATGREALATLGIQLPTDGFEQARNSEIEQIRSKLKNRPIWEHSETPATDPLMRAAAKVLIAMGPPCYRAHQQLWSVIVPSVVNLTLDHGYIPQVGYSHTAFAGLLGWVDNDYASGKEFCDLATQIMTSTRTSSSDQSVFHLMIGSSSRHWFEHLSASSRDYESAISAGKQSGNLQYAAYALGHNMYCRFFQGADIEILTKETLASLAFSRTRHNQWAIDLLESGIRVLQNLSAADGPNDISGTPGLAADDASFIDLVNGHHNQQVACIFYVMRTQQALLMNEIDEAMQLSSRAADLIESVGTQGLLPWPEYVFGRAMALSQFLTQNDRASHDDCWDELKSHWKQLEVWTQTCPDNFEHKYLLVSAELAKLEGASDEAIRLYDQAADRARESGFVQWEGKANELAAQFWRAEGSGRLDQVYWQRAFECYERWGANAKLEIMMEDFRSCISTARDEFYPPTQSRSKDQQGDEFAERHVELLRAQTTELANARKHRDAELAAAELADAANSLRLDLAARNRTAYELREERDAQQALNEELERRVLQRTTDLQKLTEKLQQANSTLESSNKELEQFACVASHDLQEPLRKIAAYCQLLKEEYAPQLEGDGQDYLDVAIQGAKRLQTLIEDLLTFARIKTRGKPLIPTSADECLNKAVENLALTIEESNATVDISPLPAVIADSSQLTQLFQNLIANALKYNQSSAPRVIVGARECDAETIEIFVRDNGIGMAPEYHSRIFKIFQRLHNRRDYSGTGIGLALCQRIVERFGGKIHVESEPEMGSTFYLTMTKAEEPRAISECQPQPALTADN